MGFIFGVLAVFSLLVLPFSALATFGYFKDGQIEAGIKAGSVSLVCIFLIVAGKIGNPSRYISSGEGYCYTDWDGRSNPTVCE